MIATVERTAALPHSGSAHPISRQALTLLLLRLIS
jgi:hypothetical protein